MTAPASLKKWLRKIGSKGGSANTPAQLVARQRNGAKGGRPKKMLALPTKRLSVPKV